MASAGSAGEEKGGAEGRARLGLGLSALGIWALHVGELALRGELHDLLWLCNLSLPILALGCLFRIRLLYAAPLLWLALGTPIWLLEVVTGGEILWTAFPSHLGGLALAALAARRWGWPRGALLAAGLLQLGAMALARLLTPPAANVNLVFAIWRGWEPYFPSHAVYLFLLFLLHLAVYAALDLALRRLLRRAPVSGTPA